MPQNPNSRANLKPNQGAPIGTRKRQKNGYWRVKVGPSEWKYTHVVLAERIVEGGPRPLKPNERVYFTNKNADKKFPEPSDIEIRIVAIQSGKPPGRRSFWARRVIELEAKLADAKRQLAVINEFYGRKPDDISGAFETRDDK